MTIYFCGTLLMLPPGTVHGAQILVAQTSQAPAKWVRDGRPQSMQGFL